MSEIFPSSESNFFDYNQIAPINKNYPSPSNILNELYKTLPSADYLIIQSGSIFSYIEQSGKFSNYYKFDSIKNSFNIFNDYIHYYPKYIEQLDDIDEKNKDENIHLNIPYLSSYKVNTDNYNPYGEF